MHLHLRMAPNADRHHLDNLTPWELGSEFHWTGPPRGAFLPWPVAKSWCALGRDAVISTMKLLHKRNAKAALWVPDFFCPEVTGSFHKAGLKLQTYCDHPVREHPDWSTLRPDPDDLVLVVNYFGLRSGDSWMQWQLAHAKVNFIEDHTHDPFCNWAINSKADYAFASLRKTYPVSDGSILWSPKAGQLPEPPASMAWNGCAFKLAAMVMKKDYLQGATNDSALKEAFRRLQLEGEKELARQSDLQISPWSLHILESGYPQAWRRQREKNIRLFAEIFPRKNAVKLLTAKWPEGNCPFNIVLIFPTEKDRDDCRRKLIRHDVYAAVHWEVSSDTSHDAYQLSRHILSIPMDQRYRSADVHRVIEIFMH